MHRHCAFWFGLFFFRKGRGKENNQPLCLFVFHAVAGTVTHLAFIQDYFMLMQSKCFIILPQYIGMPFFSHHDYLVPSSGVFWGHIRYSGILLWNYEESWHLITPSSGNIQHTEPNFPGSVAVRLYLAFLPSFLHV